MVRTACRGPALPTTTTSAALRDVTDRRGLIRPYALVGRQSRTKRVMGAYRGLFAGTANRRLDQPTLDLQQLRRGEPQRHCAGGGSTRPYSCRYQRSRLRQPHRHRFDPPRHNPWSVVTVRGGVLLDVPVKPATPARKVAVHRRLHLADVDGRPLEQVGIHAVYSVGTRQVERHDAADHERDANPLCGGERLVQQQHPDHGDRRGSNA